MTRTSRRSWVKRNDGWERTDELGRVVRVSVSRFHGPMIMVGDSAAYLGAGGAASLIGYLTKRTHPIPTLEALPVQTVRASNVPEEEQQGCETTTTTNGEAEMSDAWPRVSPGFDTTAEAYDHIPSKFSQLRQENSAVIAIAGVQAEQLVALRQLADTLHNSGVGAHMVAAGQMLAILNDDRKVGQ